MIKPIKTVNESLRKEVDDFFCGIKSHVNASISVRCSNNYFWNKVVNAKVNETSERVSFNHRFAIYSITKTFIALAILKLVEAKEIELDECASKYLGTFATDFPCGKSASVKELLTHRSGLPDYGHLESYKRAVKSKPSTAWNTAQFESLVKDCTIKKEGFIYSNIGYMYLNKILCTTLDCSFKRAMEQLVFEPLELTRTAVVETVEDMKDLVSGLSFELSDSKDPKDTRDLYDPGWCAPGLISSTAQDTAKFYGTIFDTDFLPETLLKEMLTPMPVGCDHLQFKNPCYGMGLMTDPDNERGFIAGHSGFGPGYTASAFASLIPGQDTICAVILSNSESQNWTETLALSLIERMIKIRE